MCCHATPERDGTWSHSDKDCSEGHLLLPSFIHFAEPVDAGTDYIEYNNINGDVVWAQGNDAFMWTAEQLIEMNNDDMSSEVPY